MKPLSFILLLALAAQCFGQLGVLAAYRVNRDYIARVLCVNRDHPAMHCNGHCYLARQLKDGPGPDKPAVPAPTTELALFCSTAQQFLLPPPGRLSLAFHGPGAAPRIRPSAPVFHPPRT